MTHGGEVPVRSYRWFLFPVTYGKHGTFGCNEIQYFQYQGRNVRPPCSFCRKPV
jgi:hypothetical protein